MNKGCEHFRICPVGKEYCPSAAVGFTSCSSDYRNKATCAKMSKFSKMPECSLIRPNPGSSCILNYPEAFFMDAGESFGAHSRCFLWKPKGDTGFRRYAECHLAKV